MERDELNLRVEGLLDREERERALETLAPTAGGYGTSAILAALQAVPLVGGVVAQLASDGITRRTERRLVDFGEQLNRAVRRLEDRLDEPYLHSAEFADTVEDVLDRAHRRESDGKRAYYAAALARAATTARPDESGRTLLFRTLDELRPIHLAILAAVVADDFPPKEADAYFRTSAGRAVIDRAAPGLDPAMARRSWDDLARLGIVDSPVSNLVTEGSPDEPEREPGWPPVVTAFGQKFIGFVLPL